MTTAELMTWVARLAAGAHFIQPLAMWLGPRAVPELDWRKDLQALPPLTRRIVWAMTKGIILCVFGLGLVVVVGAPELLRSPRLGVLLPLFCGCFWHFRFWVQLRVHAPFWPRTTIGGRLSHLGLACLFAAQGTAYLVVAGYLLAR